MMFGAVLLCAVWVGDSPIPGAPATTGNLKPLIDTIRRTGPDGKGSTDAARAWRELSKADVGSLPEILAGMDGASALARNWLRAALDRVLEQGRADKKPLPVAALERHLLETHHHPLGRRLAYDLLVENDKTIPDKYLPRMLDDPSPALRRDAVSRLLEEAEKTYQAEKKKEAEPLFRKCLVAARDKDQIDRAVRRLRDLGEQVDLARHLGMILDWKLIGPFPNVEQKGIDTVYAPEKQIDLTAEYDGKAQKVRWNEHVTLNEQGLVDVHGVIGQHVDAVAYALAEFTAKEARDVEIRLGSWTAFKLWVNGELVLVRGDAYTGMRLDHYVAPAHLKPGKNLILLKMCLEEPPPGLPKLWRFQVRVCDENGVAILSTTRPPSPPMEKRS